MLILILFTYLKEKIHVLLLVRFQKEHVFLGLIDLIVIWYDKNDHISFQSKN